MRDIFKLHCMPHSIVSDRDAMFTSKFQAELFKLQGTELAMSSAYHPQRDGQSEVVNKSLEQYLRAFAYDQPHTWFDWLHLVEFWFNTNYHTSTKLTLYEALYGFPPPKVLDYIPSTTKVDAQDKLLHTRSEMLALLKQNFCAAQSRMKLQANWYRSDRNFSVGDWVYLRLQPYKQHSLRSKGLMQIG